MRRFVVFCLSVSCIACFAPPPGQPGVGLGGDEDAFLSAVFDVPGDGLPRLVYADWLDERGSLTAAERAEYLRLAVEVAQFESDYPGLALTRIGLAPRAVKQQYRGLVARLRELAARGASAPARVEDAELAHMVERRGWIDEVTFNFGAHRSSRMVADYLREFANRYPIRKVTFRFPDPAWLSETFMGRAEHGRTTYGITPELPENCRVEHLHLENVSVASFQDYFVYSYESGVRPPRITARINRTSTTRPRSLFRQTVHFDYDYRPEQMQFISRWLFGLAPNDRYALRRELPRWEGNGHLSFAQFWRYMASLKIAGLTVTQPAPLRIDLRFDHEVLRGSRPVPRERCGPQLEAAAAVPARF